MKLFITILFTSFICISCFSQFDGLVINEFMASNSSTITDEEGKYEDWIELFNNSDDPISLLGLFLTDNPENIRKWECPDVSVPARGYLLIWADEDGADGELHANFKLSADGESIHLATNDSTIIDEIVFGAQTADISSGRIPNGTGPFIEVTPTPNAINSVTSVFAALENLNFTMYPNPVSEKLFFNMNPQEVIQIRLMDLNGKVVLQQSYNKLSNGELDVSNISNGSYILNFRTDSAIGSKNIMIQHN